MKKSKPPTCLHLFSRGKDIPGCEDRAEILICRWCKKTWDDVYGAK